MPADPAVLGLLATGDIEIIGRMPNSSNATFLVSIGETSIDAPDQVRGIYKPLRGERPLWDFDPGLYKHEAAAFRVSDELGWDLVPPTVVREGPWGEGSVQLFVEFDPTEHYFTLYESRPEVHDDLRRMAVFDLVANNTDRKGGHVLVDLEGRVWGIDHGVCFSPEFKLRTVIWEFGGDPIDDSLIEPLVPWLDTVPLGIAALLTDDEIVAMQERIEWLVDTRRFPLPQSRYQYPWPLL